jgi:hypothetical protein
MSVKLNQFSIKPAEINAANGEIPILVSWSARITNSKDNDVKVVLTIQEGHPVRFINSVGQQVRKVEWEQEFEMGKHDYTDTLFITVTQAPLQAQIAIVTMSLTSAQGGSPSEKDFDLQYK